MFTHLDEVNGWTLAIGLGVLAVMFVCVRLDRRIPGALIGLVGSTALVVALDLQAHGVAVLGTIPTGAPHLGLTGLSWSTLGSLAPLAAVVALVVVTQTAATTRAFAEQGGYDVDAGRDFLAVGAGSVVAGLVGSFPVDASPPRTGAVATAGGRTQAGALGAALVVVLLIPVADVLRNVPLATLAAVLIFVAIRLFNPRDLRAIARFDPFEFGLTAITLLTVVLVGVEQGIGVAVGLAILDRIRLSAQPQLHVLGRMPGTTSWAPLSADLPAAELPGVLVLLFATPLWYANAVHFREEVAHALAQDPGTRGPRARHHRHVRRGLHRCPGAGPGADRMRAPAHRVRHGPGGRPRAPHAASQRPGPAHRREPLLPDGGRGGHRVDGRTATRSLLSEPRTR